MAIRAELRRLATRIPGRRRPLILMYHRIGEVKHDPWKLAVRPERFARQIEVLSKKRTIVPMDWLASRLAEGRLPKGVATLTFDDGYADVLENAVPVLKRRGIPATLFLMTGAMGRRVEFWWDRLTRIVLAPASIPRALRLEIAGREHIWDLSSHDHDRAGPSPSARLEVYRAAWQALRPLDDGSRDRCLGELERQTDPVPSPGPLDRALDPEEIRAMIEPGLIDIGAHTVTHPSLPSLPEALQREEMETSRRACEELAGGRVGGFAYPFGDVDGTVCRLSRDLGFAYACTTEPGPVRSAGRRHELPRVAVEDLDADTFEALLEDVR